MTIALLVALGSRSSFLKTAVTLFVVSTVVMSFSRYVYLASRPLEYVSTTEVASNEDVAALEWLRKSSSPVDIVATNRYLCTTPEPCNYDDSSFLISAVARRRVFVEGPRFVIGGRPYPQWMTNRISLSTRFADSPTIGDLEALRDAGVSWFVLDERFLTSGVFNQSDWTNLGSIRYRRGGVVIVELSTT